jgi:hypothetical protein
MYRTSVENNAIKPGEIKEAAARCADRSERLVARVVTTGRAKPLSLPPNAPFYSEALFGDKFVAAMRSFTEL